jgi:hypothetical protein
MLPDSTMTVELYGASYFKAEDNNEYVSLFLGQQVQDEKAENAKGINIMKMPADSGVYESLLFKSYPVLVDISFRLKKAAGGKLGQVATKIVARNNSSTTTKAASA